MSDVDVRGLIDQFGDDRVVSRPDHPLLLRGPDVLVATGESSLVALFIPQSLEEGNPAHLASRLIATKLALPEQLRAVLLLHPDQGSRFAHLLNDFAITTDQHDRGLSTFIRDKGDWGLTMPMRSHAKKAAVKQFDLAYAAAELGFRVSRKRRRSGHRMAKTGASWEGREAVRIENHGMKYEPQNRIRIGGESVSVLSAEDRSNLRRQLIATTSGHLLESFWLEQGVPTPRQLRPHVAVGEHADQIFGLRSKAIFASAYAGVSLVPDLDREVTDAVFRRLVSARDEGWRE